ncbi:MAG TPA: DNA recombination protein RmuC [Rhodospirillales bacterium]|nr:DNA recombination protein RmuC [Rhodospirillales bacterium]
MTDIILLLALLLALAVIIAAIVIYARAGGSRGRESEFEKLREMQAELAGRVDSAQTGLNQRLDALAKRLGDGLTEQTDKTGETLKALYERLAVIDAAQNNLTDLSKQVVGLQDILSNKQARGAFGEVQMENLVRDILPPSAYQFQKKLGNGKIADCLLKLPNPPGGIVIDSKYPLESYESLQKAAGDVEKTKAARAFSADVIYHVKAIQEKYIVPGETAESALMFLPSEAVYVELHTNFRNVIEESFKRRVWIVSPTTLWATLNTMRSVLKDVRMREQAGVIQTEVLKLLGDVGRLDKRVEKLRTHFRQAGDDIEDISTSTKKISSRGDKIEQVQLSDDDAKDALAPPQDESKN